MVSERLLGWILRVHISYNYLPNKKYHEHTIPFLFLLYKSTSWWCLDALYKAPCLSCKHFDAWEQWPWNLWTKPLWSKLFMNLAFLIFLTANLHWEIWLSIHCNKTTFFCTLTIVTILVTDLKVNSGGYLLYCFAAWWISTSFTDTDRSEWICYYISHRYQKISLFLSIYQKLVRN